MNPTSLIIMSFIFCALEGCLLWLFFSYQKKAKAIEGTPKSQVRNVVPGRVEVHGKARSGESVLVSPFGEVSCVYYEFKVEEYRRGHKRSYWRKLVAQKSTELFSLEDETGKILINPNGAEFYLKEDHRFRNTFLSQRGDQEKLQRGLQRVGVSEDGFLGFKRKLRCTETTISEGDQLYVLGDAQHSGSESDFISGDKSLVIQKSGKSLFLISDESEEVLLRKFKRNKIITLILVAVTGAIAGIICYNMLS